ncbi:MAG: hypothetical protein LBS17_01650 [Actinomycetes bacterium]|jgi:D-3-phosphoglycerate dehydrogenase|nr:hypothetical protein [Actinomycetes bacterium]
MTKVLIADKIAPAAVQMLRDAGLDTDVKTGLSEAELIEIIPEYDAIAVRSAVRVTRPIIEAGTNLRAIGRAGVGIDNIDKDAAAERGIAVINTPTANIVSAAEQTMALMLACARNTAAACASMKAGEWNRSAFTGTELFEKTLGVIGLGKIGTLVAQRARAFDMSIVAYDPWAPPAAAEALGAVLYQDLDELLAVADIITVHLPKTPETTGMIGADQVAKMKDGVICLNVARGGIMDEQALSDGLDSGKIAAVGVDVYDSEPPTDSPLLNQPKATLTPHLGASTCEAQLRAGTQLAEFLIDALK